MDIKTKYNINDDVMFLTEHWGEKNSSLYEIGDARIVKGKISSIKFELNSYSDTDIIYTILVRSDYDNYHDYDINEKFIAKDLKSLIQIILDQIQENVNFKLNEK